MRSEPTGAARRQAITDALTASPRGWLPITHLADELGIDRSTVLYHAKRMVEAGTAAIGTLKQVDPADSGRPPRVVIDPARLHDFDRRPTLEDRVDVGNGRTEIMVKTYEITVEAGPDEYAPKPPRLGPVTRALRDGADSDALASAVATTVANTILAELHAGTLELVIRPTGEPAAPDDAD